MWIKSIHGLFTKESQSLGLDIGTHSIKAILLSKVKEEITLKALITVKYPLGTLTNKGEYKSGEFESALKLIRAAIPRQIKHVVIAITGAQVISKVIQVDRSLTETEIEHYLYGNLKLVTAKVVGEVNIDFVVLGGNKLDGQLKDVFVVVAKQSLINSKLAALEKAGFQCSVVDLESHALTRSFEFCLSNLRNMTNPNELPKSNMLSGVIAGLHIGQTTSLLIVVADGELVFSREFNIGISQLKVENSTTVDIDSVKKLVAQLSHSQQNYLSIFDGKPIDTWFCSGGGAHISELTLMIANILKINISSCQPLKQLISLNKTVRTKQQQFMPIESCFQIALGLAVRGLS